MGKLEPTSMRSAWASSPLGPSAPSALCGGGALVAVVSTISSQNRRAARLERNDQLRFIFGEDGFAFFLLGDANRQPLVQYPFDLPKGVRWGGQLRPENLSMTHE